MSTCLPTALIDDATPPMVLYHASGDRHFSVLFNQADALTGGALYDGGTNMGLVEQALGLPSPECVWCNNVATDWMEDNGKDCGSVECHIEKNVCR